MEAFGLKRQDDLGRDVEVSGDVEGLLCRQYVRLALHGLLPKLIHGRVAHDGQQPGAEGAPVTGAASTTTPAAGLVTGSGADVTSPGDPESFTGQTASVRTQT